MKRTIILLSFALLSVITASAQGKPQTSAGSAHSNAPAGTPAASKDRDKGTARAEDVGKGKKKGLRKYKRHKHHSTNPTGKK